MASEAKTLRAMAEEGRSSAEEAILYAAADELDKARKLLGELENELEYRSTSHNFARNLELMEEILKFINQ